MSMRREMKQKRPPRIEKVNIEKKRKRKKNLEEIGGNGARTSALARKLKSQCRISINMLLQTHARAYQRTS
jgi:hypothetical protein